MLPFWIALQFLTVIPVRLSRIPSQSENAQSVLYYPFVGLFIGLILYVLSLLLNPVPHLLSASVILVIWVWLTGGLHLDGLADTADAWVGGFGNKQRTLDIMKDPSCGPIGVLSLFALCLLKFSCIYVLLEQNLGLFLLFVLMLGRIVPLILLLTTTYVREKGLARQLVDHLPRGFAWLISGMVLLSLIYWKLQGILSLLFFVGGLSYLRQIFIKRINGITGDTIGASIELLETLLLLSFSLIGFYL
ncbi:MULTISPECIES: adenosylcobinamide-GDP ribazoletransferase [unclassified Acinetobacter]|uniref:adenosylcobinamide-GDP ribazoletransferase n=1 Tax=unclassified Acinetobacter TaxID=196816 RepID=UPI00190931A4|nr:MULTISPECIES: adenosylcobinamide-GDP ribazoletransferase [unclassified Acinetobacter]MBK0063210.1 adenosylcobinamide-GDP ribazoletransferase [Acinetobacter sp. S55]MBK0066878.1 adenosylcobinamide-GDP ribazoletransferase [Acinetobacter sp. S54]